MFRPLDSLVDQIFIINLDRHPQRYQDTVAKLATLTSIRPVRLAAVDGQHLTTREIKQVCNPYYQAYYSPGVVGCSLSHQLAWQRVARQRSGRVLILEDDVDLLPETHQVLSQLSRYSETYHRYLRWADLMYLGSFGFSTPRKNRSVYQDTLLSVAKLHWGNHDIPQPPWEVTDPFYLPDYPVGLYSYIITPAMAQQLISLLGRDGIMTHLDLQLNYYRPQLKLVDIFPKAFTQSYQTSTITQPSPRLLNIVGRYLYLDGIPLSWKSSHEVHGISAWTWIVAGWIVVLGYPAILVATLMYGYDWCQDGKFPLNWPSMVVILLAVAVHILLRGLKK